MKEETYRRITWNLAEQVRFLSLSLDYEKGNMSEHEYREETKELKLADYPEDEKGEVNELFSELGITVEKIVKN